MPKKTTSPTPATRKIRIGWFSFSCCEDSTVLFTELMNTHWQEWKKLFDFRHARVLQSHNVLDEMDIAFVEGAIASHEHEQKLKEIRKMAKKLVAIGACAVAGLPSAQRNTFSEGQKQEIEFLLARFGALPKVLRLADVVRVDVEVPGCPMNPDDFMKKVTLLIQEFQQAQTS
ncbi:MAG: hypothetical protein COT39_03810 [Parcubacteria group bacterium CG08_land_8_20_14_0_20_48_21]|nr:MAG: hypothetical protein AUK21_02425 [Parcubacteria group bacterium CG2_30_48_51]PIS32587.1 MAG: hypothetical protein COT39_03810 [Parcubacteria group bacterium CG08_land_8_20_14_0_20_48_21]PIW78827.1 MAG: hypothetical protein COZ99_04285 [Parcubacteria group bacterium CG_4_8_14_3_um_filter_48_16]PIY78000.1 MAG: hypothetical protein COY83_02165 [Parcubacteria group bacterium CG_4_10_14_0_8_um_filter_48_154]PIZ77117.1 MAG: hypothetical protein COY03_03895 [bacterium CG_4_10_14_0_2_um_filter_